MNAENNEQTEMLRAIWNEMKAMNANLGGRIDSLAGRFGSLEGRVDALGPKLDQMSLDLTTRLDEVNVRLDKTDARLFLLEGVVRDLAGQMLLLGRYVKNVVGDLQQRVTRLETRFPEPEEG